MKMALSRAFFIARGRLDERGKALYSGQGMQRLWVNPDPSWQASEMYPQDIIEWVEMPGAAGNVGMRPLY